MPISLHGRRSDPRAVALNLRVPQALAAELGRRLCAAGTVQRSTCPPTSTGLVNFAEVLAWLHQVQQWSNVSAWAAISRGSSLARVSLGSSWVPLKHYSK